MGFELKMVALTEHFSSNHMGFGLCIIALTKMRAEITWDYD